MMVSLFTVLGHAWAGLEAAQKRVIELTQTIERLKDEIVPVQDSAFGGYKIRNGLMLLGFLLLLAARVWSAYA